MKVTFKSGLPFLGKPIQLFQDPTLSAKSKVSSGGAGGEVEEEVFVGNGSSKERKKMKLFSRKKTVLFIPGFRKNKKSSHSDKCEKPPSDGVVSGDAFTRPSDASSIKSSVSSLEGPLSDQRITDSIDSGIDCLHPAFVSGSVCDQSLDKRTSASSLSSSRSLPSVSKLACDQPTNEKVPKHCSRRNPGRRSRGKGRAPIASPEDDSLLDPPDPPNSDSDSDSDLRSPPRKSSDNGSNSVHNNSASSFHTLSDCSSCSYDTDSDSDSSDYCPETQHHNSCQEGSTESDSDSDSDISQCSAYYVPTKCYMETSSSQSGVSSSSQSRRIPVTQGSTLPCNSVHTNPVNTDKCPAQDSCTKRKLRKEMAPLSFLRRRSSKTGNKSLNSSQSGDRSIISEVSFNTSRTEERSFNDGCTKKRCFNSGQTKDRSFNSSSFNNSRTENISFNSSWTTDRSFNTSQTTDRSFKTSRTKDRSFNTSRTKDRSFNTSQTTDRSFNSSRTEDRSFNTSRTTDRSFNSSRTTDKSFNTGRTTDRSFNSSRTTDKSFNTSRTTDRSFNSSRTEDRLFNTSRTEDQSFNTSWTGDLSFNRNSTEYRSFNGSRNNDRSFTRNVREYRSFNASRTNERPNKRSSQSMDRSDGSVTGQQGSVVLDRPHILVSPSPQYLPSDITTTPVSESLPASSLTVNSHSAFSRWNTTGSLPRHRISYVDGDSPSFKLEEPIYHEIEDIPERNVNSDQYVNIRSTENSQMSSFGYVQLSAVKTEKPKKWSLRRSLSDGGDTCHVISNSSLIDMTDDLDEKQNVCDKDDVPNVCDSTQTVAETSMSSSEPPVPLDTCKSIVEVRRAMKKTAFWIENATYDSTCGSEDGSPSSLLRDKKSVSEADLCNQIIDIYFGEESDSSLSSSCLDNSLDQDSSLSFGTDENVSPDDLSMALTSPMMEEGSVDYSHATFVSEPYHTSQAKTRKIRSADQDSSDHDQSAATDDKPSTRHVQVQMSQQQKIVPKEKSRREKKLLKEKSRQEKNILTENMQNVNASKKPVSENPKSALQTSSVSRVFCDSRPPDLLSEQEVDTITKLHTICNSQRKVSYVDVTKAGMIIKHFPPPKHASRISWCDQLANEDLDHHTPTTSPARKSILHQRPQSFIFPYIEDEPSPIVITRLRRSKSLSRRKEWPW